MSIKKAFLRLLKKFRREASRPPETLRVKPGLNEPFTVGRECSRLLFDFSILVSCLGDSDNRRILDFGSGLCWTSELLNRMNYHVTAFDISKMALALGRERLLYDRRLSANRLDFVTGDGHVIPFKNDCFANICCYDSFHHMHSYDKVLAEFYRVLTPGGRAIFAEPGSEHSKSENTIEFLEKYKKDDPTWIEKDVDIVEIFRLTQEIGFKRMVIKPFFLPGMASYELNDWVNFMDNEVAKREYFDNLFDFNTKRRVIFFLEK